MQLYDISIWVDVVGKDRMATGCRDIKVPIVPDCGVAIVGLYNEPLVVEHVEIDAVNHWINIWCYKVEEDRKLSSLLKQFGCGWDFDGFAEVVHEPSEESPAPPAKQKPFTNADFLKVHLERGKSANLGSDGSAQFTPEEGPPEPGGSPEQ